MDIYADNAATTCVCQAAVDAMMPCFTKFYGNPSSSHRIGQAALMELEKARLTIGKLLNANSKEIYFTSGGSEADTQAIISAVQIGARSGKKHIVSTPFEHHAVLHTLERLEGEGVEVSWLDVHQDGIVNPMDVKAAIRPDTALVTIMLANNEIGTIQPIAEIGAICQAKGVLLHTDAVQAAGHIPLDVNALNVDMLSLAAHKFHGPKGTGVLYARNGTLLTSIIEGGRQEHGKRAGTENLPGIIGMAAALQTAVSNLEKNIFYVTGLRDKLIQGLELIPRSILNGSRNTRVPGIVNFSFEGIEGESLLLLLSMKGIAASSGSACTSGSLMPSHVLQSLGLTSELSRGSLRLSVDEYNTEDEINYIIDAVSTAVHKLRESSTT